MSLTAKRLLSMGLAFILAFSLPIVVNAYSLTGKYIDTDSILIFIPYSGFGDTSIAHFNEALWMWNQSIGITIMRRDPEVRHSQTNYPTGDTDSYIYKVNVGEDYLAQCTWSCYSGSDVVIGADININPYYNWTNDPCPNHYDVWSVFMHEVGHAAGLDHSEFENAVMYYSSKANTSKRGLTADDHAGIREIYW